MQQHNPLDDTMHFPLFDHHRLDAWHIAQQAQIEGSAIADRIGRGHGKLKDQLTRALEGAFTLTSEATGRSGADRACRFRWARAEAGEAAAILEVLARMHLIELEGAQRVVGLLWRLSAMLTRLAAPKR